MQLLADDAASATERNGDLERRLFRRLPEIYLAVALLVCGFLSILTPPFFAPDEVNHAKRELELARGELLAHTTAEGVGGAVDANVAKVMLQSGALQGAILARFPRVRQRPDGRINAAQLAQMGQVRWSGVSVFTTFRNTALYPPLLYVPQALGWRLGELIGAPVVDSLWLARLFASVSAALLGWLSLRLCGGGRWALLLCLLLPTELALNASCSQDSLLLPAACLAAVLVARTIQLSRAASTPELAILVVLLSACIGARPPYLPMAFALLLPVMNLPRLETKELWRHTAALVTVLLLVSGWAGMVHGFGTMTDPAANPALQTAFVLHQPLRAAAFLLWGTVAVTPVLAVMGLEILGGNDAFAPSFIYGMLALGFIAVLWLAPRMPRVQHRARGLLFAMLLGTVLLISLSEYIIWSPVGGPAVRGLQSRYYLPLLPFTLMLPVRIGTRKMAPRLRGRLLLAGTALSVLAVMATPSIAARRFYNLNLVAATRLLERWS